jgi:hypothetical protein
MNTWTAMWNTLGHYIDDYRFGLIVGVIAGTDVILLTVLILDRI